MPVQHRNINTWLMNDVFQNELKDIESYALENGLKNLEPSNILLSRRFQLLICALLSNVGETTENIIAFSKNVLGLDVQETANAAVLSAKFDVLEALKPELRAWQLKTILDNRKSLYNLIERGHVDDFKRYMAFHITPQKQTKDCLIPADYTIIYRQACANGHLELVQYLQEELGDALPAALKVENYNAFRLSCASGRLDVIKSLLRHSACLQYAESHDYEYGERYVYDYLKQVLNDLHLEKIRFEQGHPHGVFNISQERAEYAFYMLRNFIRRGVDRYYDGYFMPEVERPAENLLDEIRFLLSIPGVRTLCHQNVTVDEGVPGQDNELLRLALRVGNTEAASLFMQLPEVRRLAEQNNHYQDELQGSFDLRQMAQDAESSMVALSKPEQAIVDRSSSHNTRV